MGRSTLRRRTSPELSPNESACTAHGTAARVPFPSRQGRQEPSPHEHEANLPRTPGRPTARERNSGRGRAELLFLTVLDVNALEGEALARELIDVRGVRHGVASRHADVVRAKARPHVVDNAVPAPQSVSQPSSAAASDKKRGKGRASHRKKTFIRPDALELEPSAAAASACARSTWTTSASITPRDGRQLAPTLRVAAVSAAGVALAIVDFVVARLGVVTRLATSRQ